MIQQAYDELDGGHIEEELKFTQRLNLHPHEYKDHVRTGVVASLLNKDKGDLIHWYETYEDEYVEKKKGWKRKKSYSVKPENINLEEYKHLLLNKLKDTLEITGFNIDDLGQQLLQVPAASVNRYGGKV